jgi:DNA adenine methylase
MHYFGGKARTAKAICEILNKEDFEVYLEPFVGAGWILQGINPKCDRYANDSNQYLIALLKATQSGWDPPSLVSEQFYDEIKNDPSRFDPCLVGFVAFGCSHSGKFFGGYARDGTKRNYALNAKNSLLKKRSKFDGVKFSCLDYEEFLLKNLTSNKKTLIYCDPPYADTTKYKGSNFDYDHFWDIMRKYRQISDVKLFISEYKAPPDFTPIWEHKTKTDMHTSNNERIEKLWI